MASVIHPASAVSLDGRALLIEGSPGAGKSSLALALIDRGATLIGDDHVKLQSADNWLLASPPPNIAGLLEIRNVGIVSLPTVANAPVGLVIRLDEHAPRHVETAETCCIAGTELPFVRLWPNTPQLALRAEWAMRLHGLVFPT